jgi:hypothetical protein
MPAPRHYLIGLFLLRQAFLRPAVSGAGVELTAPRNLSITRQYECAHRPRKIADVRGEALDHRIERLVATPIRSAAASMVLIAAHGGQKNDRSGSIGVCRPVCAATPGLIPQGTGSREPAARDPTAIEPPSC